MVFNTPAGCALGSIKNHNTPSSLGIKALGFNQPWASGFLLLLSAHTQPPLSKPGNAEKAGKCEFNI